jgi:hypothetical protein
VNPPKYFEDEDDDEYEKAISNRQLFRLDRAVDSD